MSKRQFSFPFFGILIIIGIIFGYRQYQKSATQPVKVEDFTSYTRIGISLPEVTEELIPLKHTCEGEDIIPQMVIGKPPKDTVSLALMVDDIDGRFGLYNHWTVWNIDSDSRTIFEDTVPADAIEGTNSGNKVGWSGPCPPPGPAHSYVFRVFALNEMLILPTETNREEFLQAIQGKIVSYGETTAIYRK